MPPTVAPLSVKQLDFFVLVRLNNKNSERRLEWMNVKDFEYVEEIAKQEGISRAAANLYVSQSALSKFILKLEQEMGTPLFNRIGKKFIPTYAGERCIEAARQILQINTQMNGEISDIANMVKGKIRLGFHSSYSEYFFSIAFPEFKKRCPHIELKISEMGSIESLNLLENGELDMVITTFSNGSMRHNLCYETVCKEELVVAVPEGHPLISMGKKKAGSKYPQVDFRRIAEYPLILMHRGQASRSFVDGWLNKYGITPDIFMETRSRENLLRAVAHNLGITVTIDLPVAYMSDKWNITYLSIEEITEPLYLALIYNKNAHLSNVEKELIDIIKNSYNGILLAVS